MEDFRAKVRKLRDDIDTDIIIPTEYLAFETIDEMKLFAFSPLRPDLAAKISVGDVIVAGNNFGCGSSREQAPEVIKALGIKAIIANSFARIFFRNAINNGLMLIECPGLSESVEEGDEITVRVGKDIVFGEKSFPTAELPADLLAIIDAGGLVKAMRRKNGLDQEA